MRHIRTHTRAPLKAQCADPIFSPDKDVFGIMCIIAELSGLARRLNTLFAALS